MKRILADGHVDPTVVVDGRADDLVRAHEHAVSVERPGAAADERPVVDRLATPFAIARRIAVALPGLAEHRGGVARGRGEFKPVADAVTATVDDEFASARRGERGRRPLPVERAGADRAVITSQEPARPLVERHERCRRWEHNLAVVHAVAGAHVGTVAGDQDRAVRGVVRKHRQVAEHVESPDDVGVGGAEFDRLGRRRHHEGGLVGEWPVVAVGHAVGVEADRLAAIGHDVHTIAVDRRGRADAELHGVKILAHLGTIDLKLRHHQPPDQAA